VPVEEISSSMLMPDDSGALLSAEPEELSGSVLVEDAPDGQGPPIVTALGPSASPYVAPPAPELKEAAHRALLGMPQLPTSTPAPVLDRHGEPTQAPADPTEAAGPDYGDPCQGAQPGNVGPHGQSAQGVELPAEQGPAHLPEAQAYGDPAGYDEPRLPTGALAAALGRARTQAKAAFERVRGVLLASAEERPGARPQWTIPAVTVAGLFVGIGVVGLIFALTGKHKSAEDETNASAVASGASTTSTKPVASATVATATAPSATATSQPTAVTACTLTAASQVVAPAAIVSAGVEVRPFGDAIAIGFAPTDHDAKALRLDPVTLAAGASTASHATDVVRRVRPVVMPKDTLGLAIDAEKKRDRVHGRRTLPIDPPLQVGAYGGDLVWTRAGGGPAGKLWPLSGSDDVDALRAASEGAPGETTTAITFRQGGQVWVGAATGYRSLAAKGDLSHIAGLGPSVGSPAVAVNDGAIVVAWSDRSSADAPWHIRIAHMKAGEPASEPVTFSPPPGGPGGHAMSPSLAAVPGGRFLLVWTEGPTSQQRVRAITLSSNGEPVGRALEISNEAVNSGQGQAAVTATAGAKGIVAFLQATDNGFEVAAAGIACDS
jgi:hypothetical protein